MKPSIIPRAETNHTHNQDFKNINQLQQKLVRNFAAKHLGQLKAETTETVRLIDFDPEAETKLLAA